MKRQIMVILLVCLLSLSGWSACAQGNNAQDQAKNSVVRIYTEDDFIFKVESSEDQYGYTCTSIGSGVAVGKAGEDVSYIITNKHVVAGCDAEDAAELLKSEGLAISAFGNDELVERIYVITGDYTSRVSASIVAVSDRADLAIIKVTEPLANRKPIDIRTFDQIGSETVYAIGFPAISDAINVSGVSLPSTLDDMSVTQGTISGVRTNSNTRTGEMLQHDAEISGGNSGGALVDSKGRLLGINSSGMQGYEVNYAVSSNEVVAFLESERIPFNVGKDDASTLYVIIGVVIVIVGLLAWVGINRIKSTAGKKRDIGDKKVKKPVETAPGSRHLVGEKGVFAGKRYRLERKIVIGRDPSKCQIVFPKDTPKVSAVHCTLRFDGKSVTVVDENSTCGTFIDGKQIPKGKPVVLHRGQSFSLGSASQTFSLHS